MHFFLKKVYMKNKAIYPGTFDPITYGHINIVERTSMIFEEVVLAISNNSYKKTIFNLEERILFAKKYTKHLLNVKVKGFDGLTVDFVKKNKSNILIRVIRSILDFEYELQIAHINKKLNPNLETIFLIPDLNLSFISSSSIKKIAQCKGNISYFLPRKIAEKLYKKIF